MSSERWSWYSEDFDPDLALMRSNADALRARGASLTYESWRRSESADEGFATPMPGRTVTAETMRRRYGSWNAAMTAAGLPLNPRGPRRSWTKLAVTLSIIQYRVERGRWPDKHDLERAGREGVGGVRRFPDPKTVRQRFGTLARARRLAEWLYMRYPDRWETSPRKTP
jgi:hypothetical protein